MYTNNCTDTLHGMRLSHGTTISLSWRSWLRDGVRLAVFELLRLTAHVQAWSRRARSRRQLAALDARLLQDIGVNRAAQQCESRKPFWRD